MKPAQKPEVDDQWPENSGLNARPVAEALEEFGPAGVAFYADEGLPWIVVQYDDDYIVPPARVVTIGEAIRRAIDKPVFFQALRPNSICFIVDSKSFPRKKTDPLLPVEQYGVPLEALKAVWGSGEPST